jgi:kynureninase
MNAHLERARALDAADALAHHRDDFLFPTNDAGEPLVYLCGNSLGLQPKGLRERVQVELDDWARLGVEGHFHGRNPWYDYHELLAEPMARVVGATPEEVVVMNALTVNLHLLMVSFYRPTPTRHKILIEAGAFPSDRYVVGSQAALHGFDPDEAVVQIAPRPGEHCLRHEDIEDLLAREGDAFALVMLGGVNYYTGQALDLARITEAAHAAGAVAGFDLAHAAGNIDLRLHDAGADFAAWCTYKYLNSGPGGVAGAFVHERWRLDPTLPRLSGWWGNDPKTRFEMPEAFTPQAGAAGWQLSNAPVLPMAALASSLELFEAAGMPALREKALALTDFALEIIDAAGPARFEIITPREHASRGAQLSVRALDDAPALHKRLTDAGVVCDFRRPDVVRVAFAPLYNSFEDVARFAAILTA